MNSNVLSPMGSRHLAGIDEVGRGPLAGPVIAAAVILDPKNKIDDLADSKTISMKNREKIADQIRKKAFSWGIGRAECYEIDQINILQASLLAMQRAFNNMAYQADYALVDGQHCPRLPCTVKAIVKGDQKVPEISAASIIAKVERDNEMIMMDKEFPGYGFANHKGYPTRQHLAAIEQLGICSIHRRTYGPVRKVIDESGE